MVYFKFSDQKIQMNAELFKNSTRIRQEFDKNSAHMIAKALIVQAFQAQIGSAKFFDKFFFHLIMPF